MLLGAGESSTTMAAALHNGRLGCLDSFSWQKTPLNATAPTWAALEELALSKGTCYTR